LSGGVDQPRRLAGHILHAGPIALLHGDEGDEHLVELALLRARRGVPSELRYRRFAGDGESEAVSVDHQQSHGRLFR